MELVIFSKLNLCNCAISNYNSCCFIFHQDKLGNTPLHLTITLGQNKNAKTILNNCKDLDPCLVNQNGFNVLHLACLKNKIE